MNLSDHISWPAEQPSDAVSRNYLASSHSVTSVYNLLSGSQNIVGPPHVEGRICLLHLALHMRRKVGFCCHACGQTAGGGGLCLFSDTPTKKACINQRCATKAFWINLCSMFISTATFDKLGWCIRGILSKHNIARLYSTIQLVFAYSNEPRNDELTSVPPRRNGRQLQT